MPQKRLYLSWFLFFLCCLVPAVAGAGSLIFNDAASGPVEVYSLDWIPGNSLADEALPLGTDPNAPTRFTQGYQAALGNFLDGNGNVIAGTGLNVSYEITIVASYGQIGARSPLDIDNDGFVEIEKSNFDLDASANVNFVEIYLDTTRNANSLTGTGYRDGILLMKGVVSAATGQFSAYFDLDGNNILDLKVLDQFLTNNYLGTGTVSGTGSAQLTVQIDSASVNPAYFPGVGSAPLTLFFNTSLVLPYYQQNPSAAVVGIVPELGPASGGYSRVNGLAALDSTEQIDMLFQADANSSISVGPCIDIVKEVSVDGGQTWFDANTLDDSPGTTDGAIYRFIVTNCSSVTLTDVTVSDPNLGEDGLPLIINLGTLAPEASVTVEPNSNPGSPLLEKPLLCADVPPPGNDDPIKFNLASVVGTVIGTSTTVEDSDPAYVRCLCVDIEKLVSVDGGATFVDADQCVDPAAPIATGAVEYQLVVSNCGAAILDDVRVVDSLLGIDEAVGSLLPEQVITYDKEDISALLQPDFCALFGDDTAGSRDIDNTATVTATAFNRQFDLSDADSACVSCLCTGSIGDFVWNDLDRDGIQDANEAGIAGVSVTLLMDGQTFATTTTDADGAYLFTGLCAGDYTVTVATPDGYMPSPSLQGGDAALDSNGSPADVTLTTDNSSDLTIDFGFYTSCTGSLGDFVWNDLDRDGIQDANEPAIADVTVTLLMGGEMVATTTTDANGAYLFSGLCAGDYTVTVTAPDGYTATISNAPGSTVDNDSNGSPADVTLSTDNSSDLTIDFGFYLMDARIGDYVWLDKDRDGIQDADETGLSGVTVDLRDCDGNLIETTSTDSTGYYSFTVEPGDYKVQFVLLGGYAFSPQDQGDDALDSDAGADGMTICTTLAPGETDLTWDAGMYPMPASLGDYVWSDVNNNGVQDAGEMGIPNVTVKLFDCTTDELVATTTTNADGLYSFTGLMPGSYRVEFVAPTGYTFTQPNQGGDDVLDSDANASGVTDCITLAAGESNTTVDAGLYQPAPAIDIEKYTNGEDADTPTGPMVAVGSPITWTYVVTNHGNVTLTNVMVVDNQGVPVSCPSTTLLPSEVMTCTGYGTAVAGQYANLGTVTGDYNGMTVTDSDPSHYFAAYPSIDVEKYVSTNGTNWFDADQAPGIEVAVCPDLNCDAETEYECQQNKDYYWKEYERTKYEHDSKKNDYEKKKSDRDRARSVHDKAKYNRDSSKKNCDVKQKEYESAKAKYESSNSYLDKRRMDKAKSEYDSAKSECDKKDSDYNWKKSDHDTKKLDCDHAKAEYDKAKADHSKAKNDWEKRKDRDCGVPTDPQCGTDTCQSSVYFKFVVTNTGTVPLGEMSLDDSIYDTSSCVIPATLAPGEVYDCVIGPEDAVAGQHTNTATATGTYMGAQVTDTDDANYFGKVPCTPLGTGTPGYWMNHPEAWPVDSITIGGVVYTKDKAILLMKSPVKLDKTYTMFPALVSAKLNVLSCNESSCIAATIQAADDWMRVYGPVGSGVLASSSAWQIGEPLYLLLDEYNNGLLCAPSRDALENDYDDHKGCSTKTVSYWVDSTKSWPSKEVKIGGRTYDKTTAISCMKGSKTKDGSYIMYRALASAKLNALEGNDVSCIADTLRAADEWMYKYGPCGKGVAPGSWAWKTGEPIWQKLDDYNNGKLDVVYKKDRKTTTYISYWTR